MENLSLALVAAAVGIGVTHTVLGPDHYLPFVMLARARSWSWPRTLAVTTACGVGHVLASIALGAIGLALGVALSELEAVELARGDWAAWLLIAFGLAYGAWGIRHGIRSGRDLQPHQHGDHVHVHPRGGDAHGHSHVDHGSRATFWALMMAFVLGPCEPLIPLFMVPASRGAWTNAIATAVAFAVATISTMVAATALGLAGLKRLPLGPIERWAHALSGGVVAMSGLAIIALGL